MNDTSANTPDEIGALVCCIAEDRQSCEPALRLLVDSLAEHCPGLVVYLFCPNASPAFEAFIKNYRDMSLNAQALDGTWTRYDIKPLALRTTLSRGASNVLWIDSDILITGDFRPIFATLSSDTIAVTEEALFNSTADSDARRARLWGMEVGRALPFTANTGVIRATTRHMDLLDRWQSKLESPVYREAQARPWKDRGLHVMGDQEVLTALLESQEFSHLPIHFLRRGPDILQFFGSSGYTLSERLLHLRRGMPPFVHSQGFRPWWPRKPASGSLSERFMSIYYDLSPYTALARRHATALVETGWLRPHSRSAATLSALVGHNPALTGLPLAIVADLVRLFKRKR